jgi:hypothetical protein
MAVEHGCAVFRVDNKPITPQIPEEIEPMKNPRAVAALVEKLRSTAL